MVVRRLQPSTLSVAKAQLVCAAGVVWLTCLQVVVFPIADAADRKGPGRLFVQGIEAATVAGISLVLRHSCNFSSRTVGLLLLGCASQKRVRRVQDLVQVI